VVVKYSWENLVIQIQKNGEKVRRRDQKINKLYGDKRRNKKKKLKKNKVEKRIYFKENGTG